MGVIKVSRLSQEEFENVIYELSGDEYTVLGKYTTSSNKVDVKHNVCGKTYGARLSNFRRGQRCPHCSGNFKKTHEAFIQQLNEVHGRNIVCLGEYKNTHTKIKFKCVICDHEWIAEPKTLVGKQKTGCPKCYGNIKRSHKQFCTEVYNKNSEVTIMSDYDGVDKKVDCKCKVCGNEWRPYARSLLKGCGCPLCASSKGERRIRDYLKSKGIRFESQKEYPKLFGINGGNLRFDFFLPDVGKNGLLLEYQGEQHEKPVDFTGTGKPIAEEKFEILREHDNRKIEYTKYHKIDLLEIWYYDYDNIERILDSYIDEAA